MKFVFSVVSAKSKLSCRADCGLTGSWQIMVGAVFNGLGAAAHCKRRFSLFLSFFERRFSWQAQFLCIWWTPVAVRNVNDIDI